MRKTFISNLLLVLTLNLLVKPFYILGVEAEIQNRVGTEVFGSYFALINFSFLLNILPDLGTTNWNTRNVAQHNFLLQKQFPQIITLRIFLAVFYFFVVIVVGFLLKYTTTQMMVLGVLCFNQVLASAILFLRSNLTGLHLFRQDSLVSVLDRSILALHMSLLLWSGWFSTRGFHISWLIWGQTLSLSVTLFVALFFVLQKSGHFRLKFDLPFSRVILKQSFPYALLIFVSMITYRLDSVMLERMRGAAEAGIYAMGFRFFEAFNMMAYLFAVLLLPIFSGMIRRKENISSLLLLATKLMTVGAFTVCAAAIFWNREMIALFYDHHREEAADAFAWLMGGCVSFSLQYVFGTLLTANGNLRSLIYISGIGMLINLLLNSLLIPTYGAWGAALTCCITQAFILIGQILLAYRLFALKIAKAHLSFLFFLIGILLTAWAVHTHFSTSEKNGVFSLILFAGAALGWALITRMLDLKRFIQLIKSE